MDRRSRHLNSEELARDAYEERAAVREYDGVQNRETAERAAWPEARRAAGITVLDNWRREAEANRPMNGKLT